MSDLVMPPDPAAAPSGPADALLEKFPGAVQVETREGYEGIIVNADKLVEVATTIRDDLGCNLLSNVGYVDYLNEGYFEMVYHAYNVRTGGKPATFRARTPRDQATLPSLTGVWPSADFQEREAWDLMGIR